VTADRAGSACRSPRRSASRSARPADLAQGR
jgi:hypothetical protein